MPLYDYRCEDCGESFEELMRLNDTRTPPCPKCKSERTEKQVSLVGGFGGMSSGGGSCGTSGFT